MSETDNPATETLHGGASSNKEFVKSDLRIKIWIGKIPTGRTKMVMIYKPVVNGIYDLVRTKALSGNHFLIFILVLSK